MTLVEVLAAAVVSSITPTIYGVAADGAGLEVDFAINVSAVGAYIA